MTEVNKIDLKDAEMQKIFVLSLSFCDRTISAKKKNPLIWYNNSPETCWFFQWKLFFFFEEFIPTDTEKTTQIYIDKRVY
jgi:hypothetical protein